MLEFPRLYQQFDAPIAALDCGGRCAPYNERGVPFCCDTRHAVPTAYEVEWLYLRSATTLWHTYDDPLHGVELRRQLPDGQVLIECLGHRLCQRNFRSIVCRSFPFFPYITRQGQFVGLAYYWEYEDRCWVTSNLQVVSLEFRQQFIDAYDEIFRLVPDEKESFRGFSGQMRRVFGRKKRAISLLHRNGGCYKVTPRNGRQRRVPLDALGKFGPYKIAAELPFLDEIP